ncbi:GNAT family N-acetyltransferase [Stakelama tenebrarum]|uniref:GNAT family N-acetyltransferase n=1 Tax=Stakelama tenebrarum TaxID=2711215 RepID=A0A6G6Y703_9SPHN|nr:GNAT family N-acetyltransferase [Sphingosinithalassobacter tenebrarum]QIG80631.1 GNAT family N-acetyltransferase [Sphingosinithalassobacter tenebrarum]
MITTERLTLRPPEDADAPALVAILSNSEVMRNLVRNPSVETAERSLVRHRGYREHHGLGFWAVEMDGKVVGLCGLKPGAEKTPIEGELEIGWIFAKKVWGQGVAREAAEASLQWAWENRPATRVVAITGEEHVVSQRLMEKLGMHRLPEGDFIHPDYDAEDPMGRSVTYAIERPGLHG